MLTLICGLPRAGKTTYSKKYRNVIHLDDSGSYTHVSHIVERKDDDVIVDGVYESPMWRTNLLSHYSGPGVKICIWLDTPIAMKQGRVGYSKRCEFPFEPPTLDEGWDEIHIIRGDEIESIYK